MRHGLRTFYKGFEGPDEDTGKDVVARRGPDDRRFARRMTPEQPAGWTRRGRHAFEGTVRRSVARLLVVTLVLLAGRSLAAEGVTLDYDVRYGPLSILAIRTSAWIAGERYETASRMRTEGMIGYLFPWHADANSQGTVAGSVWRPERHRVTGAYRSEKRSVAIDYDGGTVRAQVEPPPEGDYRTQVPADLQQNTIDPLTASLAAVGTNCQGTLPVFDGRRRYDMVLTDMGPADLARSRHGVYAGPTQRCRAEVRPVAGFWERKAGDDDPENDEEPAHLDFWIASPRPGVRPVPVYLELSGARGTLAIWLRAAEPLTSPPAG
jgi:hypothetical protein